jgi:hypothetical protein
MDFIGQLVGLGVRNRIAPDTNLAVYKAIDK